MAVVRPLLALALAAALAGCGGAAERHAAAEGIARAGGLVAGRVAAGPFDLALWQRPGRADSVTVYVEGDGFAWAERGRPSPDPTPYRPLALELAARDPAPAVAVVGRPCQYRAGAARPQPACDDARWWTGARFAPEVIAAVGAAVDRAKAAAGATAVHLVGYSGGGAVAALVAARREDVASLRTVAGNLDPAWVNARHGVDPLRGSLSPLDAAPRLARLPQTHFAGRRDAVVPPETAERFVAALGTGTCARVVAVEADHHDGWIEAWQRLVTYPSACAP